MAKPLDIKNHHQEELLSLMCFGEERYARIALARLEPGLYDPVFKLWAEVIHNFWALNDKVPKEEDVYGFWETVSKRDPSHEAEHLHIYETIVKLPGNFTPENTLATITPFVRSRRIEEAATKALQLCQTSEGLDEAEAILQTVGKQTVVEEFDHGIRLFEPSESLRFLDLEYQVLPTGIPALDLLELGPARKTLNMLIGLKGDGKTWWLLSLLFAAVKNYWKSAYISLEMGQDRLCGRLMQTFFRCSKRDLRYLRWTFGQNKDGSLFFDPEKVKIIRDQEPKATFRDADIRGYLVKRLKHLQGRPTPYIKDFPTRTLSVRDLERWLDGLEASHRYRPDLLCVDYGSIMRPEFRYKDKRNEVGQIHEDLRRIAVERDMAVTSVIQSNRSGRRASESGKTLKDEHMAEDWSVGHTADVVLSYNRTRAEKERGLARLFVDKARDDDDVLEVLISQAYAVGAFCFDSMRIGSRKAYWEFIEEEEEPDEDE